MLDRTISGAEAASFVPLGPSARLKRPGHTNFSIQHQCTCSRKQSSSNFSHKINYPNFHEQRCSSGIRFGVAWVKRDSDRAVPNCIHETLRPVLTSSSITVAYSHYMRKALWENNICVELCLQGFRIKFNSVFEVLGSKSLCSFILRKKTVDESESCPKILSLEIIASLISFNSYFLCSQILHAFQHSLTVSKSKRLKATMVAGVQCIQFLLQALVH